MLFLKIIFTILISLALIWVAGFFIFIYSLPLEVSNQDAKTDAIVVWTGEVCRITTGLNLLTNQLSDHLFISGVMPTSTKASLLLDCPKCDPLFSAVQFQDLRPKMTLGSAARTTIGNAIETKEWMDKNGIKSIRLVTTALHIPRCRYIVKKYMPGVEVILHPVSITKFDHRHWYKNETVFHKVLLEYNKYLVIRLGLPIERKDNIVE